MVRFYISIFSIISLSLFARPILLADTSYTDAWKIVEKHLQKELPKSALEVVNGIYGKAKREKNTVNFVKAVAFKLRLEQNVKEDDVVKLIDDLRKETVSTPFPERNILHAYLARTYLGYFNANAYLINQRTPIIGYSPSEDITQWDAEAFKRAIFREITLSLDNTKTLQETPIDKYRDLFSTYKPDAAIVTPTLYDGLATNALNVYRQITRSRSFRFYDTMIDDVEDADYGADIFAPAATFITLTFKDDTTATGRMLRLHQDLLRFHLTSGNTAALIDNDLWRFAFVSGLSRGDEWDSAYINALRALYDRHKENGEALQVAARLIEILRNMDPKKAHELAEDALERHPRSKFAPNARNLKRDLEREEVGMTIEHSVAPGKPFLASVRYRNIEKIWLRLVEYNGDIPNIEQEKWFVQLRRMKPAREWSQQLPQFNDYRSHSAEIKAPPLEKLGRYILLASTDLDFTGKEQAYGIHPFWVTNLALVKLESTNGKNHLSYFVHDAGTGAPKAAATVKIYTSRYNYNTSTYEKHFLETVKTEANGRFTFSHDQGARKWNEMYAENNYIFEILTSNDRYVSEPTYQYGRPEPLEETRTQTFFFTDRSIYRPGQTIYFKGIITDNNNSKFDHHVLANKSTTVRFIDMNGQVMEEKSFTTSEFGSFNGSFTAPVGKLNGQMHIEDAYGNAWFRVEEYKRPTFNVTFEDVRQAYKVGDSITLTGHAMSFAGANLDGAAVRYRVVRVVHFPYWYDWWRPIPYGRDISITTGTVKTLPDGSFSIGFIAKPDKLQPISSDAVFTYRVTADVTDINGETQSGEASVSAAHYSLIGTVSVHEVVERSSGAMLVVRTTNVNGKPAPSRTEIKIEKLREPEYPIRKRHWERADTTTIARDEFKRNFPLDEYRNESDMNTWQVEQQILARAINIDTSGTDSLSLAGYKPGVYKVTLVTHDPAGKDLRKVEFFKVYDKTSSVPSFVTPLTLTTEQTRYEPGTTAAFIISSSYDDAIVYYEVASHRGIIRSEQLRLGKGQKRIEVPVTEQDRGGMTIACYLVHDYRLYSSNVRLDVPWTNNELSVKIETFRSKLKPGDKDEWRITLKGPKAEPVAAEMLAAMYDASLDKITPHDWNKFIWHPFFQHITITGMSLAPQEVPFTQYFPEHYEESYDYGRYMLEAFGLDHIYSGYRTFGRAMKDGGTAYDKAGGDAAMASPPMVEKSVTNLQSSPGTNEEGLMRDTSQATSKISKVDLITPRKNFNETVFFYPTLLANDKGEISFSFTIPEALTTWRMMGYAHTPDLKTGYIEQNIITQKELMVQPNVPRFVRESDTVVLSTKISNISDRDESGEVKLSIFDAKTMLPYDTKVSISDQTQRFTAAKERSTSAKWRIVIPEGAPTLAYRIVAASESFSDGEEAAIPVLPNKMLVTETLPLNIRGKSSETYHFDKLAASGSFSTLRNHKLTLEISSNPAWYAIQALPTLMEFPYECAEQVFNRYYANSIAFSLANKSPRIKRVFDSWKGSKDALLSNLEKNEDLKQILLVETPWVLEGKDETERKERLGVLFDLNTMANGLQLALAKLREQQAPTGAWSWFPGMPESDHISQYIVAGFGKLKTMGVRIDNADHMLESAVRYIDRAMDRRYTELKRYVKGKDLDSNHLGYDAIQYLYARSFFTEIDIDDQYKSAFYYWLKQAERYWTGNTVLAQSMLGIALHRFERPKAAKEIVASLKERALQSKEMGVYWKYPRGWFWYEAPIESQAATIELFDEVAKDTKAVEELKIWLLKQKQVQDWKTTTATADACYALLGRGSDLLASTELVKVTIGGKQLDPRTIPGVNIEEGTGYFRTSWHGEEIKPQMANVTLTKVDDGIAWGGMYWQYFERLDKITPAKTPLAIEKKLFIKRSSAKGFVLDEITDKSQIKVGDLVTVRVAIETDRDMEYIHLRDARGAGFEPVSQTSSFKYRGGLGYYESIKDASTNFFIHNLPKGNYVFEYDLRASHEGNYLGGITTVQSMYAPEFASHSEGIMVKVQEQ